MILILSLIFQVQAGLFDSVIDVNPNDEAALRQAVDEAARSGQRIRFTVPLAPRAPRTPAPKPFVATKIFRENGQAITVDGTYRMRQDSAASGANRGRLADARGKVTLNGRQVGSWVGITYRGEDLWVHQKALRTQKPVAVAAVVKTTAGDKATTKPEVKTPSCVSDYNTAMKYPKFADWIRRANPYTRWNGIMGSYVDVSASGQAILHHPMKGDLPAMASMCFSSGGQPYVSVAGAAFSGRAQFPNPSDLHTLSINYEGTNYSFSSR